MYKYTIEAYKGTRVLKTWLYVLHVMSAAVKSMIYIVTVKNHNSQ